MFLSKVMYTRRGDRGETDTGMGSRVKKGSRLVEMEGTIDEFNSFLGLAGSRVKWDDMKEDIGRIQFEIFTLGEHIIMKGEGRKLEAANTTWLEERVDHYRRENGPVRLFVIPGGSEESAVLHVARTVCRRLERIIVSLSDELEISEVVLSYINRLSSVLFMMAIAANRRMSIEERVWELKRSSRSK